MDILGPAKTLENPVEITKVTLPKTKLSPLKMVVSNRNLIFQWSIFIGTQWKSQMLWQPPTRYIQNHPSLPTISTGLVSARTCRTLHHFLVGSFIPFQKYAPQIVSFPEVVVKIRTCYKAPPNFSIEDSSFKNLKL